MLCVKFMSTSIPVPIITVHWLVKETAQVTIRNEGLIIRVSKNCGSTWADVLVCGIRPLKKKAHIICPFLCKVLSSCSHYGQCDNHMMLKVESSGSYCQFREEFLLIWCE